MTFFNVRIQLPGSPSTATYDLLHAEMEAEGFSRLARANDNKVFRLPHGEYLYSTSGTPPFAFEDIWQKACRAATKVSPQAAVRLSETVQTMFINLEEVPPARSFPDIVIMG
jgi:hypothetical protein